MWTCLQLIWMVSNLPFYFSIHGISWRFSRNLIFILTFLSGNINLKCPVTSMYHHHSEFLWETPWISLSYCMKCITSHLPVDCVYVKLLYMGVILFLQEWGNCNPQSMMRYNQQHFLLSPPLIWRPLTIIWSNLVSYAYIEHINMLWCMPINITASF